VSATTETHAEHLGTYTVANLGAIDFFCCGHCGVVWGVPASLIAVRQKDHLGWRCPNGHSWVFLGENEEEKLRRQLKEERDRLSRERSRHDQTRADRDHAKASLRSTKGVVTRIKRRVANGVCPCCNRSFKDLARHMQGQHPDWVEERPA